MLYVPVYNNGNVGADELIYYNVKYLQERTYALGYVQSHESKGNSKEMQYFFLLTDYRVILMKLLTQTSSNMATNQSALPSC